MAPLGTAPALEAAIGVGTLRTYSSVTVHSARGQGPPRENALQATWVECPLSASSGHSPKPGLRRGAIRACRSAIALKYAQGFGALSTRISGSVLVTSQSATSFPSRTSWVMAIGRVTTRPVTGSPDREPR